MRRWSKSVEYYGLEGSFCHVEGLARWLLRIITGRGAAGGSISTYVSSNDAASSTLRKRFHRWTLKIHRFSRKARKTVGPIGVQVVLGSARPISFGIAEATPHNPCQSLVSVLTVTFVDLEHAICRVQRHSGYEDDRDGSWEQSGMLHAPGHREQRCPHHSVPYRESGTWESVLGQRVCKKCPKNY